MPLVGARVIACWIMEAWTGTFAKSSSHHVHGFVWMVVTQFHWDCGATGSRRSGIGRKASTSSPGLDPKWSALRIPIFALDKSFVASRHTYDDVMWSLNHCCAKTWPVCRHDGGPWRPTDTQRRRRAGQVLKNRALLVQLTGDWKMYKDIFQFPQHNELHGICWMCTATPSSMKDTSRTALARRAVGPLEISGTTSPTRQGHLAFAVRTWLSHQCVYHRLVALCRLGRLPRLDRLSVVAHASPVSRFEPGGAREQLVASHPRVVQGVPWACVRGQPDSANDQA